MADLCLTLVAPAAVEERLTDALLADPQLDAFTSNPASVVGGDHSRGSALEKVTGRSRSVMLTVLLDGDRLPSLMQQLEQEFARTGMRWWVSPVMAKGVFE
ncbi:MAG: DUF3240 family protein [Lautropia sp.]